MKITISLLALLCASVPGLAQQPAPPPTQRFSQQRCCAKRLPKRVTTALPTALPQPKSEPSPTTDFFVGEARIDVTKDETVVRLAMAQHGSVLIELPANDGPRYIIPGDPEMATVDERALERNKRAIVVRPGTLFISPPPNRKARTPAATVTAQMRSGLVVTFLFYPVEDLAQNVHRCVLSYNRDEVVARRRAAGLPVNLDSNIQEGRNEAGQSTAPTTISVEASDDTKPLDNHSAEKRVTWNSVTEPKPKAEQKDNTTNAATVVSNKSAETTERVRTVTQEALARAIKKPKQFKGWTKPAHGLALSVLRQTETKDFQVVLVAIKNTSTENVRLVSGGPDLFLEMIDDKDKPINLESIKKIHTEVSGAGDTIPAGATSYYAIAYAAPVLGVHQRVKIVVGQTNAADDPASVALTKGGR